MASPSPTAHHATPSSSTASLLSPLSSAHSSASPVPSILARSNPNSPPPPAQDAPITSLPVDSTSPNSTSSQDVDPQIMEALKSKDRIYVLKLGEQMEKLIIERRPHRLELQPSTTYQRLLVHRCSAYYRLSPESDPVNKSIIFVHHTIESRIPTRRICELVPAEPTAQPAFKIMRRSPSDRRNKPLSQAGSVAGEDADLSDMDQPLETGSLGGRSNATGGSNKKRGAMTIEEREAAYKEARTRIFMDFEEKEKEKDLGTSSSSVVSGSASTNGGSVGDIDDTGSSPATESEWSGPVTRDKNRRGGSGPSMRRSGGPYGNSSGSSRNSRAPSPSSFTYASLYEPPPSAPTLYDPNQPQSNTGYQYVVPYPQGPNPPYISPYYYPYHTYHPHPTSDPTTPANGDPYTPQQPMQYGTPYAWPPHQGQPPLQSPPQISPHPLHHQNSTPIMTSSPGTQSPQYAPQQYMPSHAYTYPPPPMAYYPPPGQHMPPPPPNMGHPLYDVPHGVNGSVSPNGFINSGSPYANGIPSQNNGNANANGYGSNRNGPTVVNGGKGRAGTMPGQARASWSFGPGISGGYSNTVMNGGVGVGDAVGPRLSSNGRRASQNSRASSICDDVSSTASSSTTSSSSRRTYTSTASSQHPLPARPDWAVGMKAQPTLTGRHHDGTQRNIPGISPQRNINGNSNRQAPLQPPASLQSMDFPPLSSMAEKRTPVVAGAWGNVSSTRSILQANSNQVGNVVASPTNSSRLEEPDKGFERPPPKSAQLFNPKSAFKSASMNGIMASAINGKAETEKDKERVRSDTVASAILVDGVNSISLENTSLEKEVTVLSPS